MTHNVIIAAYNAEKHIEDALRSVLKQTHADLRIIVVDDGSTDRTAEVIKSFDDSRILFISQENLGQVRAWERATREISYSGLVFLLDADDLMCSQRVERVNEVYQRTIFEESRRVSLFQHSLEIFGSGRELIDPRRYHLKSQTENCVIEEIRVSRKIPRFIPSSGLAIPSQLFSAMFPLATDWKICADVFLTMRLGFYGSFVSIGEMLGKYRVHESNNWCKAKDRQKIAESNKAFASYYNNEMVRNGRESVSFIFEKNLTTRILNKVRRTLDSIRD